MEVDGVAVHDETRLTQMRFDAAVKVIKSLPPNGSFQPSNDMMLKFYSYYKQATVGVCNIPRPGFWDAVGKAKWDAWNSLGEMPKEEAMAAYVNEMKLILEGMPMTSEVEEFLHVIGPFYELVEEKKKISQVSDLSTGFGTALNSVTSRSAAKSIIKMMEMNGTLEAHPTGRKAKEVGESAGEEEEGEEEQETREVWKATSQPKKKDSARRHKTPLTNGKVANGVAHLTNGNHSRAALNSDHSQEDETLLNGHHADPTVDPLGPSHLASDSDSEVYCDSVDQLGQEENSEHNHSLEDLEEMGDHVQPPVEELHAVQELQEDHHAPPHVIKCGGEDGENGGAMSQRGRLTTGASNSSLVRRGRGSKSPRPGSANMAPVHGAGDGDGGRWGRAGTPSGSLNEQIVVALARLQDDMQSVLERLHTLEALTASQARSVSLSPTYALPPVGKRSQKPSWWPFDISPTSLAFAVIWPFVVQWLISLYVHRRRRRRN